MTETPDEEKVPTNVVFPRRLSSLSNWSAWLVCTFAATYSFSQSRTVQLTCIG